MIHRNPFLRDDQNALMADIQATWIDTLQKVWEEKGKLQQSMSNRFQIQQNYASYSHLIENEIAKNRELLHPKPYKILEKRKTALENPTQFFNGLVRCYKYDEVKNQFELPLAQIMHYQMHFESC